MSEHEPKKLLIVYILEIMQKHSDRYHTLTQQESSSFHSRYNSKTGSLVPPVFLPELQI